MAPNTRSKKSTRGSKKNKPHKKVVQPAPTAKPASSEESEEENDGLEVVAPVRGRGRTVLPPAPEAAATIRARMAADREVLARLDKAEAIDLQIAQLSAQRAAVLAGEPDEAKDSLAGESKSKKKKGKRPRSPSLSDSSAKSSEIGDVDDSSSDSEADVPAKEDPNGDSSSDVPLLYSNVLKTWRAESRLQSMQLAKPEMKRVLRLLKKLSPTARKNQATLRGFVKELQVLYMRYRFDQSAADQFDVNQKSNSSGGRINQKAVTTAVKQVRMREPTVPKNGLGATSPKGGARPSPVGPKKQWNKIDNRVAGSKKAVVSPPRACYVCGSLTHMAPHCDQRHKSTE